MLTLHCLSAAAAATSFGRLHNATASTKSRALCSLLKLTARFSSPVELARIRTVRHWRMPAGLVHTTACWVQLCDDPGLNLTSALPNLCVCVWPL